MIIFGVALITTRGQLTPVKHIIKINSDAWQGLEVGGVAARWLQAMAHVILIDVLADRLAAPN